MKRLIPLAVARTVLAGCITSEVNGPLRSYSGSDAATLYAVRHASWGGGRRAYTSFSPASGWVPSAPAGIGR